MSATNRRPFYSRRPRAQPIGGRFIFGGRGRNLWAQPIGGRFIRGGRGRNLWRNHLDVILFAAAEGATYGATKRRPFSLRRLRVQPIGGATDGRPLYFRRRRAQPIGDCFIFGGGGRNLWRNQWESVLFSAAEGAIYGATKTKPFLFAAAEGATYGATKRRPFYSRRPRAQPIGGATDRRPLYFCPPRAQPMVATAR